MSNKARVDIYTPGPADIRKVGTLSNLVRTDSCVSPDLYPPCLLYLVPFPRVFLEVESVVFAAPEVFALVFADAELSHEIVVLVVDPGVVFVLVSTAHVSEPQACGGIPAVSHGLIAVSVVVLVDLDSSQRPRFLVSPNADYHASSSSSV